MLSLGAAAGRVATQRILLVDDHELFRLGLRRAIELQLEPQVIAEAPDPATALDVAARIDPTMAIVDVALPGGTGVDVAAKLLRAHPRCRVLMLSMYSGESHIVQALDAGARGYCFKDQRAEEIVQAVRVIARGEVYLDARVPGWIVDRHARRQRGERVAGGALLGELSAREREIFDLVVRGYTNDQLAQELGISIKTVETHRTRINRKLRVHSTAALVRFAAAHGLVQE